MRPLPSLPATLTLGLLALGSLGVVLATPGCVVRYGDGPTTRPAEPLPPPNDFVEVQTRLEGMLAEETDVDRRDRMDAALDLLRSSRTMNTDDQDDVLRYLQRFVSIEERNQPMEAPTIFETTQGEDIATPLMGPSIEEVDLGGVEQLGPVPGMDDEAGDTGGDESDDTGGDDSFEQALPADDALMPGDAAGDAGASSGSASTGQALAGADTPGPAAMARASLVAGDPAGALAALEPCDRMDCGPNAAKLRQQAIDAYVHAERERAGALFVRARSEPDASERAARLEEARVLLATLLDRYPTAAEADAIRRNIETVQKELETLR